MTDDSNSGRVPPWHPEAAEDKVRDWNAHLDEILENIIRDEISPPQQNQHNFFTAFLSLILLLGLTVVVVSGPISLIWLIAIHT